MTHPAIRDLFVSLGRHEAFQSLIRRLPGDEPLALSGLTATAKALYLLLLWQQTEKPLLIVTDGAKQAETLFELVQTFFDLLVSDRDAAHPILIPALDVLPFQDLSPHSQISEQRAIGLWRMASGKAPIVITPVGSALLRTGDAGAYRHLALTLRVGEEIAQELLVEHLVSIGYQRREPVEMVGEFSIRGGIVDIFPAEAERPVRIETFGDLIESMRQFEVDTQRSVLKIAEVSVLPLVEHSRPPGAGPGWEFLDALEKPLESSIFSMAAGSLLVWDEPEQVQAAATRMWKRLNEPGREMAGPPENVFYAWEEIVEASAKLRQMQIRELDMTAEAASAHIATRPAMTFHGNMKVAVSEARTAVERGGKVVFFAPSSGELERMADILQEYSVPFQLGLDPSETAPQYLAERAYMAGALAGTFLMKGSVRRGAYFADAQIAIYGSEDLFDSSDLVARPTGTRSAAAAFAADLADLKAGDYVVHETHGIAKFQGLREIVQGDTKGDFMVLEYAGEAKLYVPLTRLDLVQKFRGSGDSPPSMDRLGGATWSKTKSRVKAKMRDMADELVKLYAARRVAEGFAFSPDSNWQREFEDAFEYNATKDQLAAMVDIKRDMESDQPMDRLLCGDVGFGKTEVAMRAAFKALGDGKQVALLAPTTVLAFQHFETFKRRFAPFPVNLEMLSRFRTAKEIKAGMENIAAGKADIIIGTHRILSKDVEFADLGLLIVDEEQRFGVRHKERLKQIKKNVDVLTMSATPIPRTLHMSLLGLRDLSVIETPPKDRMAINTVVTHFNNDVIRSAIEQELGRGGQVYFIHNRVDSIFMRASSIQEMLPQARVGVGHGQMGDDELERVLLGFMRHEYDVFVCTTIAENGLDIPLANTILIENAERYGLSELYQLRGRVGRSNRRAYAYLLVPENTELSEIARKRLAALREFSDLGAGFKIAALDLELRGAGNLLGGEQHGQIEAVGFDMYVRMLEEAVRELKGEEVPLEVHSTLNLGLDIRIPPEYIADENQRLRAYKRIADVKDRDGANRILSETEDRYGPAPEVLKTLLEFSLLKTKAQQIGVELVEKRSGMLNIKLHQAARIEPAKLMALVRSAPGAQFTPAGILRLPAHDDLLGYLQAVFNDLARPTT